MSTRALRMPGHNAPPVPLEALVERWLADGLITADQAARIISSSDVVVDPGRPRGRVLGNRPVVAEAVGYLGGAVTAAGAGLVGAYYWEDLSTGWRLGILLATTVLLLGAGLATPDRLGAPARRIRSVLWLAASATWAGAAGVFVTSVLDVAGPTQPVLVATAATALTTALWTLHRYGLQQVAMMASTAALAATLLARSDAVAEPGLGVWAVGGAWALLGRLRVMHPPEVPLVLGSATAIGGAMSTGGSDRGLALTLITVAVVVVGGILARDLLVLTVGSLGALANVPVAVSTWFPDSVLAAVGILVVGLGLVGVAVWVVRRPDRS